MRKLKNNLGTIFEFENIKEYKIRICHQTQLIRTLNEDSFIFITTFKLREDEIVFECKKKYKDISHVMDFKVNDSIDCNFIFIKNIDDPFCGDKTYKLNEVPLPVTDVIL